MTAAPAPVNPDGNRLNTNRVDNRSTLMTESKDPTRNAVIAGFCAVDPPVDRVPEAQSASLPDAVPPALPVGLSEPQAVRERAPTMSPAMRPCRWSLTYVFLPGSAGQVHPPACCRETIRTLGRRGCRAWQPGLTKPEHWATARRPG